MILGAEHGENMTYETMDWEAEAERVARAFGVRWLDGMEFACRFVEKVKPPSPFHPNVPPPHYRQLTWENDKPFMALPVYRKKPVRHFRCEYNQKKGMTFAVDMPSLTSGKASYLTDVTIHWRGHVKSRIRIGDNALFLAKGIYHLGLLTPEVEAALHICITAQDKADWTNEIKGITACATMNWDVEAKRIACAFDLKQEVAFEVVVRDNRLVGRLYANGEAPLFQKNLRLNVGYGSYDRSFTVKFSEPSKPSVYWRDTLSALRIRWDGPLLYPAVTGDHLCEGLFNLGLLTSEIEATLNVDISARQKNTWARAYEKRKKRKTK